MIMKLFAATLLSLLISASHSFAPPHQPSGKRSVSLYAADENKAVSMVSGEDLELLLQNMEQPLVVDAYATWWYVQKI